MPTTTSRLLLTKPLTSETADIAVINANMDQIDEYVGSFICTSTTRPTGADRFTGMVIYETDTKYRRMWTNDTTMGAAGWVWCGGKALAIAYRMAATATQSIPNSANTIVDYFNDGTVRREFFPGYTANISAISVPTASQRGFKINETGLWLFETGMTLAGSVSSQTWAALGAADTYATLDYRSQSVVASEASSSLQLRINDFDQYCNQVVFQNSGGTVGITKANSVPYVKFTYLGA